jgi:hypothetical protein
MYLDIDSHVSTPRPDTRRLPVAPGRPPGCDHDHGDSGARWRALLERYRGAWADANPIAIMHATAPGYRFHDPLVGLFTRWSLPQYFDALQLRVAAGGPCVLADLAFRLHGPMDGSGSRLGLKFWREAPRLGLAGIAEIQVGERGVVAETVTYDLNLAADLLRRTGPAY